MTDYHALAEHLIDLQTILRLEPGNQQIALLERGTFLALHYLMITRTAIHPKELSRKMAVSSARIAALLKHLESEGLIVRKPDPDDNRQVIILLTRQGEQLIQAKRKEAIHTMAEALEELGPEEAETYLCIQRKLLQNFIRRNQENKGSSG